jgi:hypothetical protein
MLPDMKFTKTIVFLFLPYPRVFLASCRSPLLFPSFPKPIALTWMGPLLELKKKSFWKTLVNATSKLWKKKKKSLRV